MKEKHYIFKIEYTLGGEPHFGPDRHPDTGERWSRRRYQRVHVRKYTALSESTALEMFKETVASGSLIGEDPEIVSVTKLELPRSR